MMLKGEIHVSFNNIATTEELKKIIPNCTKCPRLVQWCQDIKNREKVKDYNYWCKPVPPFGDSNAQLAIIGLAPGAEGANRTGRVFTGDEAGILLYKSLYMNGYSNREKSIDRNDNLKLINCYVTNAVKCVPPKNTPKSFEIINCRTFLKKELQLLKNLRIILCIGGTAFKQYIALMKAEGVLEQCGYRLKDLNFGHGKVFDKFSLVNRPTVVTSFHTSGYNVKTGKISQQKFNDIIDIVNHEIKKINSIDVP